MKKVVRLRISPIMSEDQRQQPHQNLNNEPMVRTTGRIKKPKAVFDPSDNYLPRAQRLPAVLTPSVGCNAANLSQDSRNSLSRMSTTSSDNNSVFKEVCVVCGKRESKRTSFALKNPLLSCLECETKIHRLCLKAEFDDFEHIRQTYRCESCTPCVICLKTSQTRTVDDSNKLLICSKCAKVYHCQCLQQCSSTQNEDPMRDWTCPKCALHLEFINDDDLPVKKIREIIGDHARSAPSSHKSEATATIPTSIVANALGESALILPNESDIQKQSGIQPDELDKVQVSKTEECSEIEKKEAHSSSPTPHTVNRSNDQSITDVPDVQNWSVEQVFKYFRNHFPKEAHVFIEQEIDGRSLLLLKRSDVVKKLPLKLGPSLRIYSAILKIQSQQNDPTLGWNCSL